MSTRSQRWGYKNAPRGPDDPALPKHVAAKLDSVTAPGPTPEQEQRKKQADYERKLGAAHARGEHPAKNYEFCTYCKSWRYDAALTFVMALQSYYAPLSEEQVRRYFQ